MTNLVARFIKNESGATAIEYSLIAALLSVGIITAVGLVGSKINATFNFIADKLATAAPAS